MAEGGADGERTTAAAAGLQRRCYVAVVFSDLCDYTALSESADPEEIIELRQEVERLARDVIGRHNGDINQFAGDGILAVFGLPTPDENSARHAIEAALDLHEAVRSIDWKPIGPAGFRVRFHSGVHAGLIFARRGDPLHGKYEITGDAVNTAARLCSAAQRDEVLVSVDTLSGLESFFQTEEAEVLSLKGKLNRVSACRVASRSSVQTRFEARKRRALTPFVGRGEPLEAITNVARHVRHASGDLLCVVGDPGSGKTRLLDEVSDRLREDGIVMRLGSCESHGGVVVPLRPFVQILGDVVDLPAEATEDQARTHVENRVRTIDPRLAQYLQTYLRLLSVQPWPTAMDGNDSVSEVISALAELLMALAQSQATLLVLDDWHWADSASTQVLGRLARAFNQLPMLILVGTRRIEPDDPVLSRATRLDLQPFTEAESVQVVHAVSSSHVQRSMAQRLHLRSGGNPLFLEELCRSVLSNPLAVLSSRPREVPSTLQALIHNRVEGLSTRQAEVLRVASVIGDEFSRSALCELVGESELDATLSELVRDGLVYVGAEAQTLRFRHGITREVTYQSVRLHDRRRLHAEVARGLEERQGRSGLVDHYELLAAHYAGASDYARAVDFADLAGDKAARSSALDVALAQYAAALAHADHLPGSRELRRRWLTIASKWASVCIYNPAREHLATLARAAEYASELGEPRAIADANYWTGWLQYTLGDQKAAVRHLERALQLAEEANDAPFAAQILVNLGQSHAAWGAYPEALELLNAGIERKRARSTPKRKGSVPGGLVYALGCRALVQGERGEFPSAYAQMQEAFSLVRDTGNALEGSLYCLLGMLQLWQGDWLEATRTAAAGHATAERVNGPYVLAMCRLVAGYAGWVLERSAACVEQVRGAVDWLDRHEMRLYLSFGLAHLADALLDAGQSQLAYEYANRALLRAAQTDPIGGAMAHRTLARLELQRGRQTEAREHCRKAQEVGVTRGSERDAALCQLTLAGVERALGHSELAEALLAQAGPTFERLGMPWHAARARPQ